MYGLLHFISLDERQRFTRCKKTNVHLRRWDEACLLQASFRYSSIYQSTNFQVYKEMSLGVGEINKRKVILSRAACGPLVFACGGEALRPEPRVWRHVFEDRPTFHFTNPRHLVENQLLHPWPVMNSSCQHQPFCCRSLHGGESRAARKQSFMTAPRKYRS